MPACRFPFPLWTAVVCLIAAQVLTAIGDTVQIGKASFDLPKGWVQFKPSYIAPDPDPSPVVVTIFRNPEGTVWVFCFTGPKDSYEKTEYTFRDRTVTEAGSLHGCPYRLLMPSSTKRNAVILLPSLQTCIQIMTITHPVSSTKELLDSDAPFKDDELRKVAKKLIGDLEAGLTLQSN